MGVWAGVISGVLCALTFWSKARIRIGRLKLRYKLVRRNAALVAVIGVCFLLTEAISLGVRNVPQPAGSSADSASKAVAIDPEQAVVRCFCETLSADRRSEARENSGVAGMLWPFESEVDACVERLAHVDEPQADAAWSTQRQKALKRNNASIGADSRAICAAAGMPMYEGEPPPVGPEIMQGAREEFCQRMREPKDHDPGPDYDPNHPEASRQAITEWSKRRTAEFAARFHISIEQADAAINRAAAERYSTSPSVFLCPGEKPPPTDAELDAPPTEAEIAGARSAFCQAAREHPEQLIGDLRSRAVSLYTASATELTRDRWPMVFDKVEDDWLHDGFQRGELLHGEQVTENYCN